MGKCVLSFDQIELVNKKSDTPHSDNDWMVISWFVGDKTVRTDKFPLLNTDGSTVLDSGNAILPFTSEVDCTDDQVAIATVGVVNLGSFDPSDQVNAVGDLAESIAQESAKIYLKEVELYLRYSGYIPGAPSLPGPISDFLADRVEELTPILVNAVGTLFEEIIIPLLGALVGEIQVLLGKPNCNGDVFHDIYIFKPLDPIPAVSIDKTYDASHVTGCGSSARTRVHVTQSRELDPQMQFANTPPPQVSVTPAADSKKWANTWAEDPSTPTPIIQVVIAPSAKAAGQYSVQIKERVDPRFDIEFVAAADPVAPHDVRVFPYIDNVFGTVRPWVEHPVTPTQLSVATKMVTSAAAGDTRLSGHAVAGKRSAKKKAAKTVSRSLASKTVAPVTRSQLVFKLGWQTSQQVGAGRLTPINVGVGVAHAGSVVSGLLDTASGMELPAQGVTLCLYQLQANGQNIGTALRYIRNQNMSFTRADVMLVPWDPLH